MTNSSCNDFIDSFLGFYLSRQTGNFTDSDFVVTLNESRRKATIITVDVTQVGHMAWDLCTEFSAYTCTVNELLLSLMIVYHSLFF